MNATAGGNHDNRVTRRTYHHTELEVPDRLSGTFSLSALFCVLSLHKVNTGRQICWRRRPQVLEQLCALIFIFLAVLPPPLGGFWTRFSGLFGQVERDPEEAEFGDLGRSPPSLSLPVRLTPLRSRTTAKLPPTPRAPFPVGTFRSKTATLKTLKNNFKNLHRGRRRVARTRAPTRSFRCWIK